jgi:hypothetical protein
MISFDYIYNNASRTYLTEGSQRGRKLVGSIVDLYVVVGTVALHRHGQVGEVELHDATRRDLDVPQTVGVVRVVPWEVGAGECPVDLTRNLASAPQTC